MLDRYTCGADCVDRLPVLAICHYRVSFVTTLHKTCDSEQLRSIYKSFPKRRNFLFSQVIRLVKVNHSPVSPGTRQLLAKTLQNLARGAPQVQIALP